MGFEASHPVAARIVYYDCNGHIHELSNSGGAWATADLNALTNATTACANPVGVQAYNPTSVRIVFSGCDDDIHELTNNGGAWHTADLTKAAGSSLACSDNLAAFTANSATETHIAYVQCGGHVHDLYLASGRWKDIDLNQITGGLAAGSTLISGFQAANPNAVRISYAGSDGWIHEMSRFNGVWATANLVAAAGGA